MNFPYFISRKVASSGQKSFTRLILVVAVVAIALSLTVMIATTALISGFKKEITEKIFGFWGHIHITDTNVNRSLFEALPIDKQMAFVGDLEAVKQVEYQDYFRMFGFEFQNTEVNRTTSGGVRHIQSFAIIPGIIQTKNQIEGILLKGVGLDFDWTFLQNYLLEGNIIEVQKDSATRSILISRQTADRLEISVGDKFVVHFIRNGQQTPKRFEVAGIYKTGLEEYDRQFALVDIRVIQELMGWTSQQVAGFEVFLDDVSDLSVFADYIYYNVLPNSLYAETIREKFPAIFEWLELQDLNEMVILVLMLVVAIINMITVLLILILERTNMIGILKALGETDWGIRKIFLYYAAYIVLMGLFWGNIIGLGFCLLQKYFGFIRLSEADYYLSVAPVHLNFFTVLLLNLGTLGITLLFLIIPSWLVAKISPIKAIRFE